MNRVLSIHKKTEDDGINVMVLMEAWPSAVNGATPPEVNHVPLIPASWLFLTLFNLNQLCHSSNSLHFPPRCYLKQVCPWWLEMLLWNSLGHFTKLQLLSKHKFCGCWNCWLEVTMRRHFRTCFHAAYLRQWTEWVEIALICYRCHSCSPMYRPWCFQERAR